MPRTARWQSFDQKKKQGDKIDHDIHVDLAYLGGAVIMLIGFLILSCWDIRKQAALACGEYRRTVDLQLKADCIKGIRRTRAVSLSGVW